MYAGLGILPVIVTTAVNLLVPAIEGLFKSNTPQYSFPVEKTHVDQWAGIVNLDPTLETVQAQWAWNNIRCMAGDVTAIDSLNALIQTFPVQSLGPVKVRISPDGPLPGPGSGFTVTCSQGHADAASYALSALRVLTTRQAQPNSDLYSGTLPAPLPSIPVPVPQGQGLFGGITPTELAIGGGVLLVLLVMGRR